MFTSIKQPRDTDGHGREYNIEKNPKQLRAFHLQFQAICALKKNHWTLLRKVFSNSVTLRDDVVIMLFDVNPH